MAWQNADGLYIEQPQDKSRNPNSENEASYLVTYGARNQIEVDVNFLKLTQNGGNNFSADLNNDGTRDGFHGQEVYIPHDASILQAYFVSTEAAAGGTSFTVGLRTAAGAVINDTGIFTATEGVLANINAVGKRTFGAGAYVAATAGTAGIGSANAYVYIATTGSFTAGKGRLIIEYIDTTGA